MSVKLDHVNITVNNLEESLLWYKEIFGFEKVESGLTQYGKKWAIVACEDSMIAMSEDSHRLSAEKMDEKSHLIYHFGIRVPESEAWRNKVKNRGLKLYYGGEIKYPHSCSWYIHDPSGHEIEVSCTEGRPMQFA